MFARKYVLNHVEELWCLCRTKTCERSLLGRCTYAAKFDKNSRCSHWFTKRSANLSQTKFDVARIMDPIGGDLSSSDTSGDKLENEDMSLCSDSESESGSRTDLFSQRRQVEYTPYAISLGNARKHHNMNAQVEEGANIDKESFTVVTFNVLSQWLLNQHRYLYSRCRPRDLKWSTRRARLLRDFEYLNPDVLCLQEVEEAHLEFFTKELGRMGYTGIYKKRTHDKVDGSAVFFKSDKFLCVDSRQVELYRSCIKLLDRDNVGVIVKLALKTSPTQHFVVATSHLLYTPRRTDIRLTQTQLMLAEMEKMAYRDRNLYWPIIYTGDMNYTPESPVYELVTNGYLDYDYPGLQMGHHTGSPKDLLPKSVGVTDSCQYTEELQKRSDTHKPVMHGTGVLDHSLHFASVYDHVKSNQREATTYQDQWHTVDYIFYSMNDGRSDVELRLVSRLGLPNVDEAENDLGHIPNDSCGSDHLPLIANFHLARTGS